jgi:hypothetical protein
MRPSKKLSEIPDKRRSPGAKVLQFADNEGTIYSRPVGRKIHEGYAKARAAKIREGDALFELQGSSERLQRINSMKSNIEQRSKTQRFLVNQIKNGWPYDEKFYRPSEGGPPNNENTSSSFS